MGSFIVVWGLALAYLGSMEFYEYLGQISKLQRTGISYFD
jgi:hypothetical protein